MVTKIYNALGGYEKNNYLKGVGSVTTEALVTNNPNRFFLYNYVLAYTEGCPNFLLGKSYAIMFEWCFHYHTGSQDELRHRPTDDGVEMR